MTHWPLDYNLEEKYNLPLRSGEILLIKWNILPIE